MPINKSSCSSGENLSSLTHPNGKKKQKKTTRKNKQQLEEKQTNKQTTTTTTTTTTKTSKPSTVVPELVTLDCSLTHVLQVPNTQPYHS